MKKIKHQVETIFCDDIRHEVGGKLSFMGTFFEVMYVKDFPIILPKFCISIKVVSFSSEPMPPMQIKILLGGKLLDEKKIQVEGKEKNKKTKDVEQKDKANVGRFLYAFSPLEIKNESEIEVNVFFDDEDESIKGLGLKILKAPLNSFH
jgi:hypothetical protein